MTTFRFDKSGAPVLPSDEELATLDKEEAILAYTDGMMEDGRPYYAYVAVTPSMYPEFYAKTCARESLSLGDYGTIIACGFEESPSESVVAEMREQFGFDEGYETKLLQEAKEQQLLFMKNE